MSMPLARVRRWKDDEPAPVLDRVLIPLQCERCGRYAHPTVDLTDADRPMVEDLPDNCVQCGEPQDTPEIIRDLVGTARNFAEAIHKGWLR